MNTDKLHANVTVVATLIIGIVGADPSRAGRN